MPFTARNQRLQVDRRPPIDQIYGTANDYARFSLRHPMTTLFLVKSTLSSSTPRGIYPILLLSGPNGGVELSSYTQDWRPAACTTLLHSFATCSIEYLQNLSISNLYVPPRDIDFVSDFWKPLTSLQSLMNATAVRFQEFAARWVPIYCLQSAQLAVATGIQRVDEVRPG
ncbi:hypothetical protein BJ322DRAFT_1022005 [Thelephora terrestris]|uniref:Uncharacterized protein n=1 Tax=Thelephora terrestris TaxID=56493 RepID=A0A9P6HB22_9AGAM|nr:hypothetical protein BJ322DRAFT_1022005 [Thelephora terrestris]